MAFSAASALQSALALPIAKAANGGAAAVGNAINSTVSQATSNFNVPSSAQLQAEAAAKLKSTGNAANFSNLSNQVGITEQNGTVLATSLSTGAALAALGSVRKASLPSSFLGASSDRTNEFKVHLSSTPKIGIGSGTFGILDEFTLNVMPSISESRSASYKSFSPLHHPGEILKFENTAARTWNITGKLIARTVAEASLNLRIVNTIRSWVMPFFGEGTFQKPRTKEYLGAPPPIITLKAYGGQTIGPVKCVLENYSWDWPNDVDYLPTDNGEPFPVIINISLQLKESWSPAEYSGFDIIEYREGRMPSAFRNISAAQIRNNAPQTAVPSEDDESRTSISEPQNAQQADVNAGPQVGPSTDPNFDSGQSDASFYSGANDGSDGDGGW